MYSATIGVRCYAFRDLKTLLAIHLISKLYENTSLLINHQSRLHGLVAGVRRCQNDNRHARPADAPLRHHRDRQYQLAVQEPFLTKQARRHDGAAAAHSQPD